MKIRFLALFACVVCALGAAASAASATTYVALGDSYSSGTGTRTYYDIAAARSRCTPIRT